MISRRSMTAVGIMMLAIAITVSAREEPTQTTKPAQPRQPSGWQLPPDAENMKSPLTVDDKVLATGRAIFKDKCQRCHGPGGRGDGPDADPDVREDMDLTDPTGADRNPEGVIYYKVSNGRRKPKMPAFKEELKPEQIWSVAAYVQTLRKK
jgi:mono/diheme cytochrome c family protein